MSRFGKYFALVLLLATTAGADLPPDQDDLLQDLGVFDPSFFAELQDLQLIGDRAYVFGVGGLAVLNISDTNLPFLTGRFEPVGHPYVRFYRGAVDGNLAIGGAREDLVFLMEVPGVGNPEVVAHHGLPGQSFEGAALAQDRAYLCAHGDGLEILDVTDPYLPILIGTVRSLTNAWDVALSGNHAYVADGAGGLAVIDIADPADPVHLTSVPTSGAAADVVTDGSLVVVSCGSAGIDIFTLDDPANPVHAGTANTSGLAITSALAGNTVYVADWDDVEAFDLTDPTNPQAAGGENTPVRAMGLDAREGLVAVTDWSRVRLYRPGPSLAGDIDIAAESLQFGDIPVGSSADLSFTIGNTGSAAINVSEVAVFSDNFQVLPPAAFTVAAGQTHQVTIRFTHAQPGYDATFVRIFSDDTDEAQITISASADDNPSRLDLGDQAPDFTLQDLDGVAHRLSDHQGRIVVMAFFANW